MSSQALVDVHQKRVVLMGFVTILADLNEERINNILEPTDQN